MESEKTKAKLSNTGIVLVITLVVLLLVAVSSSIYFYRKSNVKIDSQEEAVKDLARTIKMVGKHIVLPTDEQPTMATVSDPEKLKDQPFFVNAKKGYKVLIFSLSKKAILYDPVADRIVEVAPINASGGSPVTN
jgi:flagellar basal body-associated protein FliL